MKLKATPLHMVLLLLTVCEIGVMLCLDGSNFIFAQKSILLAICLICFYLGRKEKFVANPYFCFIFTPISLLIYDPSVSLRFLTEIDNSIYCVAVLSFIAFLFGVYLQTQKHTGQNKSPENSANEFSIDYQRTGLVLVFIWLVYQFANIVLHISIPFSAIVVQSVYIGISFLIMSQKTTARIIAIITMILILVTGFRKTTFLYVFMLALLSVLINARKNKKTLIWGTIAVIVGGYFLIVFAYPLKSYFRENGSFAGLSGIGELMDITDRNNQGYGSLSVGGWFERFMLRPYLSMTTEWTNINYVLNTQGERTYGMWFLKPILNILQINTEKMSVYNIYPRSNYYNTYGFLTIQIKDFGYVGAIILTYFEGVFAGWVYRGFMDHQNSPIRVTQYVFVSCAVLEMFFSNHYLLGGIHIVYLVSAIILLIIKRVNKNLYKYIKS